jgi:hypothetical protein
MLPMTTIDILRIAVFGICLAQPLLLAHGASNTVGNKNTAVPVYNVSPFHISDLRDGTKDEELTRILTTTGILSIRVPILHDDNHEDDTQSHFSLSSLSSTLCKCAPSFSKIQGGDVNLLHDHRTTRHTIATATMGLDAPVPLPHEDIVQYCGRDDNDRMNVENWELARDYVSHAVSYAFLPALDRILSLVSSNEKEEKKEGQWMMKRNGDSYHSISSIVQDAIHLEHFHVYHKNIMDSTQDQDAATVATTTATVRRTEEHALKWHTDAGLFLAFLPAMNCVSEGNGDDDIEDDASFYIKVPTEDQRQEQPHLVQYPVANSNEILVNIMMGAGMEEWIQSPTELQIKAARHAVKMKDGESRAWFGSMYLVPNDAMVGEDMTFSDLKKHSYSHTMNRRFGDGNEMERNGSMMMGCGMHHHMEHSSPKDMMMHHGEQDSMPFHRRRLQHVGGPDDCNNDSNFFCWMSCLEVDDNDLTAQEHLQNGEALYCLNPSILAETKNVSLAVASCSDPATGIAGGIMDENCGNYWLPKVDGVQTHVTSYSYDFVEKYCYGKTAMYMQGFSWEGTTCLVYLFSSWVISTRLALVCACIGTIVIGIFTEFAIRKRRTMLKHVEGGRKKLAWSAIIYGAQLAIGYILMLIVMTYSGPLVLSVILGLVAGHVIWNYSDVVVHSDQHCEIVIEGSTPCCQNVMDDFNEDGGDKASDDLTAIKNCGCV